MGSAAFMVSVEQFWGEKAGGSTLEAMHRLVLLDSIASLPFLGVETSDSVKTSPCIELTSEQEGEQDLVLGGRGGASDDKHLLGGKELVEDLLGTDVIIDPMGLIIISILCPDYYRQDKAI